MIEEMTALVMIFAQKDHLDDDEMALYRAATDYLRMNLRAVTAISRKQFIAEGIPLDELEGFTSL